ncbi:MAG: alginate O-acetyltransferase complex protein AlgI [Planctomycetota bacterium]
MFSKGGDVTGPEALLGVYAFALQIYCDFSGYSDIARGISRMMGIELALNFRRPYFSVSPSDFWQRWHISLSSWLRDYLYIPLGGSRASVSKTYRNLALTMLIGGLWHGPTWMFVLWGAWHGMVLIIYRVLESDVRRIRFADLRGVRRFLAGLFFFHLVCIGWLFFRAESVEQVTGFLSAMGSGFEWSDPVIARFIQLGALALLLLFIDTVQEIWEENGSETPVITRWPVLARGVILFLMGLQLAVFGVDGAQTFIYFQF